ncbi:RAB3A interacting protein [Podila epigama]|nr:RAB3A interacting protein [Podila epigama]
MTEELPVPPHPAPEPMSKDVSAKDIANLYSRIHNLIETVKEPQRKATVALNTPIPTESNVAQDTNGTHLPADDTASATADKPKTEDVNGDAQNEVLIDGECPCHRVCINVTSRTCGLCDRVIPALADAHNERALLLEELEQTKVHLAEEQKRASTEAVEAEVLRKKIEDLEDALDAKTDDYLSTQRDLAILNDKYVDEIEKVAELQHAKEMVESELEELSRTLFEEANGMVASEARARHQLELTRKHLELELKDAQERLAAETSQLKELKLKMETMMEGPPSSKRSSVVPNTGSSVDLAQLFGLNKISVPEEVPEDETPATTIAIDGQLMHEFKEFVAQSSTVRLAKIHSLPFMRHCQDEDVEPCLRFGSSPRISARKLTEGISTNTCYIEEATEEQVKEYERQILAAQQPPSPARNSISNKSMLWDRLQAQYAIYQAPKGGCQCCGRSGPLTHRYRIATSDDWSFIDRFCRDRLVAVCEFYIFIRNIRAGLYSTRTIEDLYSESLRLRLQMFYARAGVLPIMLSELGVTTQSIGNVGPSAQLEDGANDDASLSGSAPSTPKLTRAMTADESEVVPRKVIASLEAKASEIVESSSSSAAVAIETDMATAGPEPTNPWINEEKKVAE